MREGRIVTHKGGQSSGLTAGVVGGAGLHLRVSAAEGGQLPHGDVRAPR